MKRITLASMYGLFSLACMVGCADSSVSQVEGAVTLDSRPLGGVNVLFQPVGGQLQDASTGKTDDSGRFVLTRISEGTSGAVVGLHQVSLTTVNIDASADERTPLKKDLIPAKYQNGVLTFEVPAAGTKEADFDLQSP